MSTRTDELEKEIDKERKKQKKIANRFGYAHSEEQCDELEKLKARLSERQLAEKEIADWLESKLREFGWKQAHLLESEIEDKIKELRG